MDGARLEWSDGRFTRAEASSRPPADYAPGECHEDLVVTPGLLDAHCHLDYAFMAGAIPATTGFVPWLRAIIASRRESDPRPAETRDRASRQALQTLLGDGVTAVWDIDTAGHGRAALADAGLDAIGFAELIVPRRSDWHRQLVARFAAIELAGRQTAQGTLLTGLSPHSTYSVCPPALEELGRAIRNRPIPLAIHLAESPEEHELLIEGRGGLREALAEAIGVDPAKELGIGRGAIERADAAGLLTPWTLAIHCNLPEPGGIERLKRSGAVVVFCPGSHRYFGYPPYPLAGYLRAGLPLALGADSLASNPVLSMRAEMRTLLGTHADLQPIEALGLAAGAGLGEAAPFGGRGRLLAGRRANWALWRLPQSPIPDDANGLAEMLLDPATECARSSAWTPDR
jgi:cytosine/adenosine deaminase-related metal-dependent hydrolase